MSGFPLWAIGLVAAAFAPFVARAFVNTLRGRQLRNTSRVRSRAKEMRERAGESGADRNPSSAVKEESGDLPPIEADK